MQPDTIHGGKRPKGHRRRGQSVYAALDLGSNNCRLLIARPAGEGFQIVDSFSRIVRLGEGVAATGRLSDSAMERTLAALSVCARKLGEWRLAGQRCIATQACRVAQNGPEFLARVKRETGLAFTVISPREEAELSVLGCRELIDPAAQTALIVDVGGGSTELSWIDVADRRLRAWTSLPFGVVTLAETYGDRADEPQIYEAMVSSVRERVSAFVEADAMRPIFQAGAGQMVGTSGAVTSLAGVSLNLPRYRRDAVDGIWLDVEHARNAASHLRAIGREGRARHGCIGPDRADLVVPGAAILEALFTEWPVSRVRVADRGLREGVLMNLMSARA
jgi:exopolyphosphatase / guanosine-5'-triphosphate,3'-diphosphate pyrophosphatase